MKGPLPQGQSCRGLKPLPKYDLEVHKEQGWGTALISLSFNSQSAPDASHGPNPTGNWAMPFDKDSPPGHTRAENGCRL